MTPVSIAKIVASVSVFIAAGSAALVLGVAHVQHEEGFAAGAGAVTAMTSTPQAAAAVRSDTPPAAAEAPTALAATRANPAAIAAGAGAVTAMTSTPQAAAAVRSDTLPAAAEAPTALAATRANPAAIAAEVARPPDAVGKDRPPPSFDIARVEAGGDAAIAGRAAPGATVDLLRGGERLGRAVADASGEFVMVPPRLPAGSYELTLSAKSPDGTVTSSERGVAVTVKDAAPSARAAQSQPEDVPETASQPGSSSEPRLRTDKPQQSAGLQPAQPIDASSASDKGASSPAVASALSSKVVSRGESLWRISRVTYGDGARYALVYRANRERIRDPNLIYPGQTLVLPAKPN